MITLRNIHMNLFLASLLLILQACNTGSRIAGENNPAPGGMDSLAGVLEESLFHDILRVWYPRNLDTVHGGYVSSFEYDWSRTEGPQVKALVQQARHVWTNAFIYRNYPEKKEFLDYAAHGFRFLEESMWDDQFGGFYVLCHEDGSPVEESIGDKRVYGQAFAMYGLSACYGVSRDPGALELAKKTFHWIEEHAHDPVYGGYFEMLHRDGSPVLGENHRETSLGDAPGTALKDYNSSIHLMEALTELYRVWPDSLVRARLEEMFLLIRDTFVHPDGYLHLYFYPDWELVPEDEMRRRSGGNQWYTQHFTYGHDVETAFLLLETAHTLGETDLKTLEIARRLVDHSLASGWDRENGGFYDAGKRENGTIRIINDHKSWWGQAEGLNALLLMHSLYPGDPANYYGMFLKSWEHIETCLIDQEYGGWYNAALDTHPESRKQRKSHLWKTTYHNVRAMVHCIQMLREESGPDSGSGADHQAPHQ